MFDFSNNHIKKKFENKIDVEFNRKIYKPIKTKIYDIGTNPNVLARFFVIFICILKVHF